MYIFSYTFYISNCFSFKTRWYFWSCACFDARISKSTSMDWSLWLISSILCNYNWYSVYIGISSKTKFTCLHPFARSCTFKSRNITAIQGINSARRSPNGTNVWTLPIFCLLVASSLVHARIVPCGTVIAHATSKAYHHAILRTALYIVLWLFSTHWLLVQFQLLVGYSPLP